jgi:hypothetical protein
MEDASEIFEMVKSLKRQKKKRGAAVSTSFMIINGCGP